MQNVPQGAFHVTASGTVKATIQWTGQGSAPSNLWLVVHPRAEANGTVSEQALNGWTDEPVIVGTGQAAYKLSEGRHLRRYPVSNGKVVLTFALFAEAISEQGTLTSPTASCLLETVVTDKKVILSRGDGGVLTTSDGQNYTGVTTYSGYHSLFAWPTAGFAPSNVQSIGAEWVGSWSQGWVMDPQQGILYGTNAKALWASWKTSAPEVDLVVSGNAIQNAVDPSFMPDVHTYSPTSLIFGFLTEDNIDKTEWASVITWQIHRKHENWNESHTKKRLEQVNRFMPFATILTNADQAITVTVTGTWNVEKSTTIAGSVMLEFPFTPWSINSPAISASVGTTSTETVGQGGGIAYQLDFRIGDGVASNPLPGSYYPDLVKVVVGHFGTVTVWNVLGTSTPNVPMTWEPSSEQFARLQAIPNGHDWGWY